MHKVNENRFDKMKIQGESSNFAKRKYSNYKFYFINSMGISIEIKKIHIYDNEKEFITLNKPWFEGVDALEFEEKISLKAEIDYKDNSVFYMMDKKQKYAELYIPNSIANFKKIDSRETSGFFKRIDTYKSDNVKLGYHVEEVNVLENKEFLNPLSIPTNK